MHACRLRTCRTRPRPMQKRLSQGRTWYSRKTQRTRRYLSCSRSTLRQMLSPPRQHTCLLHRLSCRLDLLRTRTLPDTLRLLLKRIQEDSICLPRRCTVACPALRPGKRIQAGTWFLPPSCHRRIPLRSSFPGQLYSQYTAVPLNLSCIRSGVCQLCSLARTSRRARIRRWSCTCLADM